MEGIKFDNKIGLLDLVLSGKKTMFRLVSKKRVDKPFKTKFSVGQKLGILQPYRDTGINPEMEIYEIDSDDNMGFIKVKAKNSKGWDRVSQVLPELMPYFIQITSIKTERITEITDEDCLKEGITPVSCNDFAALDGNMPFDGYSIDGKTWLGDTPQEAFMAISPRSVKKDAWTKNNFVDVYEFKVIKGYDVVN